MNECQHLFDTSNFFSDTVFEKQKRIFELEVFISNGQQQRVYQQQLI